MDDRSTFPAGKRIAFTGRLASMSRAMVTRTITERGGFVRERVTPRTDMLVIGADGWPLRSSGRITRNLLVANELQNQAHPLVILGESEFVRRLSGDTETDPIRSMHTIEQLSRLLNVSGLRIRHWIDIGLVHPTDASDLAPRFDYREVAAARTLAKLIRRGVKTSTLVDSLRTLKRWLPDNASINGQLVSLENRLLVRDQHDRLIEPNGQLQFCFGTAIDPPGRSIEVAETLTDDAVDPDSLFDLAFGHQQSGQTASAIEGYQRWLNHFGDDDEVLFNLANAYMDDGDFGSARGCYRRCVRANRSSAGGWNNLGLCLHRLGDASAAVKALRRAVDLETGNTDYLFNLADVLEELDQHSEASLLWIRIARSQCESDVADYARRRMSQRKRRPAIGTQTVMESSKPVPLSLLD